MVAEKAERRIQSLFQAISYTPPITVTMTHYQLYPKTKFPGTRSTYSPQTDNDVWISSKVFHGGYYFYLILMYKCNSYNHAETKVALVVEHLDEDTEPGLPINVNGIANVKIENCNFKFNFVARSECLQFHEAHQQKLIKRNCISSISWSPAPLTSQQLTLGLINMFSHDANKEPINVVTVIIAKIIIIIILLYFIVLVCNS